MAKIWERFKNGEEADAAREADGAIMSVKWATLAWLYMDDIPGESRLDFLRRANEAKILKGEGFKEMKKLEKEAKNG